jgi:hypothetical protein
MVIMARHFSPINNTSHDLTIYPIIFRSSLLIGPLLLSMNYRENIAPIRLLHCSIELSTKECKMEASDHRLKIRLLNDSFEGCGLKGMRAVFSRMLGGLGLICRDFR